jgi:hypothetical protein
VTRQRAVLGLAALLAASFVAVAATRRLHFDEALALRAGWLLTGHVPAAPPFAMPLTAAAGAAARAIPDPGSLFLVLRLVTSLSVLAALAWAARRTLPTAGRAAGAVVLTLLSYVFVAHGVEFRYDAAILVGLLVAFGLVVRGRERDYLALGAVAAFVGAHHAKGLLFGVFVLAAGALRARGERRLLARLAGGAGTAALLWLGLAAALGFLPDAIGTVATFGRLGAGAARQWPWETPVARTVQLDAVFWIAAFAAVVGTLRNLVGDARDRWRDDPGAWALLFLAATLGFIAVHPMPWPYMLVLPAPFAAILVAARAPEWFARERRVVVLAALGLALLAQTFLLRAPLGAAWWASVASPATPEVEALRTLRTLASPSERVFDPSGLAYFLPPCTREWYVDSLFEPSARSGRWMADASSLDPQACPWVLFTYRLDLVPPAARARFAQGWEMRAWGLGLRRGDERLSRIPPPAAGDGLTTFW